MWQDMGIPEDAINPDWHDITLEFIDTARRYLFYKAFVAEVDNAVVGSASCQIFGDLFPNIFKPEYRKTGYIWGVYVEPSYRRQGIGKQLTSIAVEYLKAIACTQVVLNGSPASRMLRTLLTGIEVCLTVTLLDGLVMARSAFHHSMNYRSVVIFGTANVVKDAK